MLTEQCGVSRRRAGLHSRVAGWSVALIRRAARRIGGKLLDGVESGNHAAGRPRLAPVEGHADTRSATATARFCCSSRPISSAGDSIQQLHKLCLLGQQGRPRHQVRRGPAEVPGVKDPYELERWNPKLKLIREIRLLGKPEVAGYPTAVRLYTRFLATSTTLSRKGRFQKLGV
jgi:hypothetical protein